MVMLQKVLHLNQRAFLKGTREFVLEGDFDLRVTVRDHSDIREQHVDLRNLRSQPSHVARKATLAWLIGGSLAAGALALIIGAVASSPYSDMRLIGWAFGVPLLCFSVILLRKAAIESYDWLFFDNRYTEASEVMLFYRRPDDVTFNAFVQELQERIRSFEQSPAPVSPTGAPSLVEQLRALAELHTNGALTAKEFEMAKQKLLASDDGQRPAASPDYSN